jgi:hypothetical protein
LYIKYVFFGVVPLLCQCTGVQTKVECNLEGQRYDDSV